MRPQAAAENFCPGSWGASGALSVGKRQLRICIGETQPGSTMKGESARWLRTPCPSCLLCPLSPSACFHLSVSPSIMSRSKAVPCLVAWDPCAVFLADRFLNNTEHAKHRHHRSHAEPRKAGAREPSAALMHVCLISPKEETPRAATSTSAQLLPDPWAV